MGATQVRVKDSRTGAERVIKLKAYDLLKKRYTAIAFLDEQNNQVEDPGQFQRRSIQTAVKSVKKKGAEPVDGDVEDDVSKIRGDFGLPVKRGPGRPKMTQEQIELRRKEMLALNDKAIEEARKKSEIKNK